MPSHCALPCNPEATTCVSFVSVSITSTQDAWQGAQNRYLPASPSCTPLVALPGAAAMPLHLKAPPTEHVMYRVVSVIESITSTPGAAEGAQYKRRPPAAAHMPRYLNCALAAGPCASAAAFHVWPPWLPSRAARCDRCTCACGNGMVLMVSVVASITRTQLAWHGAQYSSRPPAAAAMPAHLYTPNPSVPKELQSMLRTRSVSASITSTHDAEEGAQNNFLPPSAAVIPSHLPPPSTPQGTLLHISVLPSMMSTSEALYGAQNSFPRAAAIPAHLPSPEQDDHAMVRVARARRPACAASITSTSSAEDGAQNSLSSHAAIPTYLPEPRTPEENLRTEIRGLAVLELTLCADTEGAEAGAAAVGVLEAAVDELPQPNQAAMYGQSAHSARLKWSHARKQSLTGLWTSIIHHRSIHVCHQIGSYT